MEEKLYPRGCDSARIIQVIETKSARGSGVESQPSRIVTQYWSFDGELLAEIDPIAPEGYCVFKNYLGGQPIKKPNT